MTSCVQPMSHDSKHYPLVAFRFPLLRGVPGVRHRVFSRRGGISPSPFDSLNVSASTGDGPLHVAGNLRRIKDVLRAESLVLVRQVHGSRILEVGERPPSEVFEAGEADALMTRSPWAGLLVKLADCQGVLLYDPGKRVLALVHNGWRGSVQNLLGKTVAEMGLRYGTRASDVYAGISPSLGPCCAEFRDHARLLPEGFQRFRVGERHFDFWEISRAQLGAAGLREDRIQVSGICTRCRRDLFFSYRGEGVTGRFAMAAVLDDGEGP